MINDILKPIIDAIAGWLHRTFPAHSGPTGYLFMGICAAVCAVIFVGMQQLKPKGRKLVIVVVTFLAGLFYVAEFYIPTRLVNGQEQNALTPYLSVAGDVSQIISAFALGLGVYTLGALHGKNIIRGRSGWPFSLAFFAALISITFMGIFNWLPVHKDIKINNNLNDILFVGGLNSLDATMFSIIAFYIASAAYRAFRVRNLEASLLMGAAFIVMLGQVYAGQWLTHWLPTEGPLANLRVETMSDWLLTRVNAPAIRAVGFGLGVGLIATALRIWLSLERGSYFEKEL